MESRSISAVDSTIGSLQKRNKHPHNTLRSNPARAKLVRIPLRQWIGGVLNDIRGSNINMNRFEAAISSEFLESSLKVAVCLAQQIIKSEDSPDIELLPLNNADFSTYVYVTVRTKADINHTLPSCGMNIQKNAGGDKETFLTPLPFACGTNNEALSANSDDYDILARFLCNTSDGVVDQPSGQSIPSPTPMSLGFKIDTIKEKNDKLSFRGAKDETEKKTERIEGNEGNLIVLSNSQKSSETVKNSNINAALCLDYLTVESAQINHGKKADFHELVDGSNEDCKAKKQMDRIHRLGLLFYELFSAGEIPPPELVRPYYSNVYSSSAEGSLCGLNLEHDSVHHQSPMSKIRRRRECTRRLSSFEVSIEYLRLMGLPSPLCDLIYNMLNSINADLTGDDAYSQMSDVITDLQLMLENPSKFLQDLDLSMLSSSGLKLEDTVFMRQEQLASLCDAYQRFTLGSSEFAVIYGIAGTGKSWLANRFGKIITIKGGLFLSGKFDQMKQPKPFSALASAFNEYFVRLNADEDPAWKKSMSSRLNLFMGQDLRHLIKIIPALNLILECDDQNNDKISDQDCVNGQKRIVYLFCRFIEILSNCLNAPITLFLDDVQWSDAASVSVISQVLKCSQQGQFFFLGCCRDDDIVVDNLFWKTMKDCKSDFGIRTTIVELGCINENSVKEVISDLLCLSPRLVSGLSNIIYNKTKGNPMLLSQLLQSLNQDGILRLNLGRRRWEWDEEKIQSRELPEDLVTFFVSSISRLPLEVQGALCVISCFGASIECRVIEILESKLGLNLAHHLAVALDDGLVYKHNDRYRFSHDRIQEAAYCMIKEEDRCLYHFEYGRSLVKLSIETMDDELLFTSVNQINLAGPAAVSNAEEAVEMSYYNLVAGKKAIDMSDFTSAYSHFDNGISFLKKNHWKDSYSLSLQLVESAARCSLVLGDSVSLAILSDQVDKYARCYEDKLNILLVVMTSLEYSSELEESVEKGLSILFTLGYPIPASCSTDDIIRQINDILPELSKIMNFNIMTDNVVSIAMKFLARMQSSVYHVNPALQPLITLEMIRLTVKHGVSPVTPVACAYLAGLLAKIGQMDDGYRLTKLAKELHDKIGSKEFEGQLLFVTSGTLSFFEPVISVNDFRVKGEESAMAAGDVYWACLNRASFCGSLFWAGMNLQHCEETLSQARRFMAEQNHLISVYQLNPICKSLAELVGNGNEGVPSDQPITYQLMIMHFHNMFISFMFNRIACLKKAAEGYFACRKKTLLLLPFHAPHVFIGGLVSFRLYRETRDRLWAERGGQFKSKMICWAEHSSLWNFEHKSFLLEAEEYYSNSDLDNAQVSYEKAISSVKAHKNLCDEALAWELAGNFLHSIGNRVKSIEFLVCSHEKYKEWGAFAKATALYESISSQFGSGFCGEMSTL